MAKKTEKTCANHIYGDGWIEIEGGVRVRHNYICKNCEHRKVVKL